MDVLELLRILNIGERVDLECKEASGGLPKSIWESYSAMANTDGGMILLGIKEDKGTQKLSISGVKNASKRVKEFWDTLNSAKVNVNLLIDRDVEILNIEGLDVIVINVPRAKYNQKPIYINGNILKGTYKRNYEGDYICTESEIKAMIRDASDESNDSRIIPNYGIDDLDKNTLKQYRHRFSSRNPDHVWNGLEDEEFLIMLGAIREDRIKKEKYLTIAGALMFGKGYIVRELFSNLKLDYMEINNNDVEIRWDDRFTIDGSWENNLYNFYFLVMPKLTKDIKVPFKLENLERQDDTLVHKAIREAFINALIHADYSIQGEIKVIRRLDRYEFYNLGNLKINKEIIFKGGISMSRNPKLQLMFRMIGLGENAGSGFPVIISAWDQQHWRLPELEEDTNLNLVSLKLWMLSVIPDDCLEELKKIYGKSFNLLNDKDKVLALVTAYLEGKVTNSRLQEMSNNHPYDITKMLHDLEENKFLVSDGYGKGKIYYINPNFLVKYTGDIILNENEEKVIEFIKEYGFISNQLSRERLGLTKGQNTMIFKSLISKGLIISEGVGRGIKYKINNKH